MAKALSKGGPKPANQGSKGPDIVQAPSNQGARPVGRAPKPSVTMFSPVPGGHGGTGKSF